MSRPLRIVVVTGGTAGDLHPFIGLAEALQRRGHAVDLIGTAAHAAMVEHTGLRFHPLGTPERYAAVLDDPEIWHPTRGVGAVLRHAWPDVRTVPDAVRALAGGEPAVLVAHPIGLAVADLARAAHGRLGVVAAYLAPSNLRTVHDPMRLGALRVPTWVPMAVRHWMWRRIEAHWVDPALLPPLNAERAARGLAPVAHSIDHVLGVADRSIALFPDWFAPAQPDWPRPLVHVGFPLYQPRSTGALSRELEDFLAAGDAPVVATAGSGHRHAAAHFARVLGAVQRLGRRAVLLNADRAQLPAQLPAGVLWQPYAPFHALLPRVAALVHHGGIGTTAEALRAGVPQVVTPFAHDQFDNAARVEALGVGRSLLAARLRPAPLARALRGLIDSPAVAGRCADAALRFQRSALDAACDAVEAAAPA